MKVHSIKTDNYNILHKVQLRQQGVKKLKELNVLDLFAGNNILWSYFDCNRYYGVEKEINKGTNLTADNLRVIQSLDLSKFNVIDCDSYGFPIKQIIKLYENETLQKDTIIFYTAIGSALSSLSTDIIKRYNLKGIYKKCKVLLNKKSHKFFYSLLYGLGITSVFEYSDNSRFSKNYGYFIVK